MDISHVGPRLLNWGLTPEQITELSDAAARLPSGLDDGTLISIPQFPGLSLHESELLVVRFLDRLAMDLGLPVESSSLYDALGWPTLEELLKTAERYEQMHAENYERA
jgi:hypothetical protein